MRIHTLVAWVGLARACLAANTKCYYPNGRLATTDSPCDPDAEHSICCFNGSPHGKACLANKMCESPDGKIIRGSCTDRTWASPECAKLCELVNWGGANLVSCSNVTNKDTFFCCEKTEKADCCDRGVGRFELQPPQPMTLALWNSSEGLYTRLGQVSTSSSTSTILTTSASTPFSELDTSTTTSAASAKETGSRSSDTEEGSSTRPERESTSPGGLPIAAQAGIGVGAAAILILLALSAWLLWKHNKNKQALATATTPSLVDPSTQPSPYVQEWYKQQQQQQSIGELRTGRDWDHHRGSQPSAELPHHGPYGELPAETN